MPVIKLLGKPQKEYRYMDSYYKSKESVQKVIRYITRSRVNENRANELLSYGGCGISFNYGIEAIIDQFIQTQRIYEIDNWKAPRRLYHETYSFTNDEMYVLGDWRFLDEIGYEICRYYFNRGYESLYAVHYDEEKYYHIHIVHNSMNYLTGRRYCEGWKELKEREIEFFQIVCNVVKKANLFRLQRMIPIIPFVINEAFSRENIEIRDQNKKKKYSEEWNYDYGYFAG